MAKSSLFLLTCIGALLLAVGVLVGQQTQRPKPSQCSMPTGGRWRRWKGYCISSALLVMLGCGFVLVASGLAQDRIPRMDTVITAGLFNGRFWVTAESATKTAYLAGYHDHEIVFSDATAPDVASAEKENALWPPLTIGEISKGLDNFYGQPENLDLPIRFALRVLAMKVVGRPQPEIDGWVTAYRRMFFERRRDPSRIKISDPSPAVTRSPESPKPR
jgi:hypothetical protein